MGKFTGIRFVDSIPCMQESENPYPQDIQRNSTKRQMFHGLILRI
ncbi:hypothetical protein BACCOPRO_02847 [Phocaeicola coprophilus DSM 18228 = JCM 13818]|uniref:Uncharacterized protein n=1 Tax=Phocaeicola coprophilus DSM 18228 = JCM 13818 TaxID=547042 RepID=S0FA67_9BACT|nr:hypothetical protein BACCOPRO_02847 [Phocaeicola coprophilus DSM 18228 = JCM 13818]